jgi:protein subunit release factor A
VLSETERYFTPEFMNRIDAVCIFHPLTRAVMADIARREIGDLLRRDGLTRRGLEIDIADEVIEQVVALGYSPHYGARYLKRQIEKTITYPLAREINALPAESAGGGIRLYVKHGRVASEYLPSGGPDVSAERLHVPAEPHPNLAEIRDALPFLGARVEALEEVHRFAQAVAERNSILAEMADVSFWDNQAAARRKLDAYQRASSTVDLLSSLRRALESLSERCALPNPSPDSVARPYKFLTSELPRVEFTSWLSGAHDTCGAYMQIGTKSKLAAARQWVVTLAKMYLGWAKVRRLSASVLGEDQSPDGRNYAVRLVISGFGVYGLLQGETGVHRLTQLVKVAGQENLQKLSANVGVLPELSDDDLPSFANSEATVREWNRNGLLLPRLTTQVTIRQAGHRLTLTGDLPSEDLAAEAARILRTTTFLETGEHPAATPGLPSGSLVRSYVLNTKDKGVHDHRTGKRSPKVKQVLAGDVLQEFLDEALQQRAHQSH